MAETIAELEVRIRTDLNRMRSDLKKAEKATKKTSNRMTANFKKIAAAAKLVKANVVAIAGLLVAMTVGKFAMLAKEAIAAADALGTTAAKLGLSVSALQELEYAAGQSGIGIETLRMGIQRFGRRASEAASGTGEAQQAIEDLEISLLDTNGVLRSTEDLFMDAMEALGKIKSPLEQIRLGFKLFDSEAVGLVVMAGHTKELREEAVKLGLVLDDEVVAAASETKNTLDALAKVTKNQLAPALIDLGGEALIGVMENMAKVAFWANKVYRHFADIKDLGLSNVKLKVGELGEELDLWQERLEAAQARVAAIEENKGVPGRNTLKSVRTAQTNINRLNKEISAAENKIEILEGKREDDAGDGGTVGGTPADTLAEIKAGMSVRAKLVQEAHDDLLRLRGEDVQLAKEAAAAKLAILDKATEEEKKKTNDFAEARKNIEDALEIEIVEINKDASEEIQNIRNGLMINYLNATGREEEAIRLQLSNEIEALKEHVDEKNYLHSQFLEDKIRLEDEAAAEIQDIRDKELEDQKKKNEEKRKDWDRLAEFMEDGFNDALASMLLDGEFTFKALADSFLREFVKIGIAKTTAGIFGSLGGLFGGGGGGSVPGLEGIDTNFSGVTIGGGLRGFANGGPTGGGPILVGESGPELFMPGRSGFVANNQSLAKMGGGGGSPVSVTVINNTGQETSTTERDGPGGTKSIEVMVGKAISKNIARGGDVDQAIRNSYGVNRVGRHGI